MKYLTLILLITITSTQLFADSGVFKWTDEKGVVHYGSKANNPNAKKADLPPINRADVKLTTKKLITCDNNAGIDCQAGADKDGSVICRDGFTGASPIYRFSCNSPKLKINSISDLDKQGLFDLVIRNTKGVSAENMTVFLKLPEGEEVELVGPKQIDGLSVGQYKLSAQYAKKLLKKPTIANLRFDCKNCP